MEDQVQIQDQISDSAGFILICGSSEGEEGALAGCVDECMPLTCCPEQGISVGNFIYEREKLWGFPLEHVGERKSKNYLIFK